MTAVHPGQVPKKWEPGMSVSSSEGPPTDLGEMEEEPQLTVTDIPLPPVMGYEGVSFSQDKVVPPPPVALPEAVGDLPPQTFTDLGKLDEEDLRAAMLQHVSEHCCYGSKPAKEMKIKGFKGVTALHYILETFAEGRETRNAHAPYMGGLVDGPENGPPPLPWDIPCQANELFKTHQIQKEVPHTSIIRPCHGCDARGWNWCWRCGGRGRTRCSSCGGRGHQHVYDHHSKSHVNRPCSFCHGSGHRICFTCGGDGRITCRTCQGYRQLRCFILLTVSFTNHKEDYILETTDMPDELVRKVGGDIIFEDTRYLVEPIVSYPAKEVNDNSQRLVAAHKRNWPAERILQQRQTLRGVPVTEVEYKWDDIKTRFWVYGNERKVYAPDYPHQCCWGCEIL